jgi:AmiR/NasT family two-component response regulator
MGNAIRVLVANRPKLMRDLIVSIVAEQPEVDIAERIRQTMPDLVVVALDDPKRRPELCDIVLSQYPGTSVIAVPPQANRCVCYWTVNNVESRDIELSERGFLTAVRDMAERVGAKH